MIGILWVVLATVAVHPKAPYMGEEYPNDIQVMWWENHCSTQIIHPTKVFTRRIDPNTGELIITQVNPIARTMCTDGMSHPRPERTGPLTLAEKCEHYRDPRNHVIRLPAPCRELYGLPPEE
jgi:hypothetical protein